MKSLTALEVRQILRKHLPYARFRLADADYNLPTKRLPASLSNARLSLLIICVSAGEED
jgi:hypothetical protein